jgi:Fe(3+) dicitrate transport protein
LLDATAQYQVAKWNTRFFLSGKNLLNERYIASRRPQGIRVGLPRLLTAGIEIRI